MIVIKLVNSQYEYQCQCDGCFKIVEDTAYATYIMPVHENEVSKVFYLCEACNMVFSNQAEHVGMVQSNTLATHIMELFIGKVKL